jgi:hypothetical protein
MNSRRFQLIEEHFNPMSARAGLQNIELAGISQGGTSLEDKKLAAPRREAPARRRA